MKQVDEEQKFRFPLSVSVKSKGICVLFKIFQNQEICQVIKLAPDLNRRMLYTTSVERQMVAHMLC